MNVATTRGCPYHCNWCAKPIYGQRYATRSPAHVVDEIVRISQVVIDVEPVKSLAMRLLRLHALRAFDALQLAAALRWAEGHPQGRTLHTLDGRLARAARLEGFLVPA